MSHQPTTREFPFLAPPQAADEIGRLGSYRVLSELGVGGMGIVFRAEDPHLQRQVALKVMLPEFAANPEAKTRFLREARAQAKVEHEHVAAIFQVGEDRGVPFLAMPLLKGMTLQAALKANPRPPLVEVIRIGREIAEGLAAAHEQGLVHRDIKPANIWLEGKKLRVRILDFGLARAAATDADNISPATPLTRKGTVVGTPAYMSLEQARGLPVDGRSDLWSVGVLLYQMTTGDLPFRGETSLAILTSISFDTPTPPQSVNPAIPPQLSDFVMRLLAKDPEERPPTAEAVVEELRKIETGLINTVRVIPLDAPAPIVVGPTGPDPFAELNATEANTVTEIETTPSGNVALEQEPARASVAKGSSSLWIVVAGALLAVAGVVWFVAAQFNKKPVDVVNEEPPKPVPLAKDKTTAGEVFVLKYGTPAVEMRFRWIPPGKFSRGTPAREITISKGFWMAETECTQAQWRSAMKTNPDPSQFKGDTLPVENITAAQAEEFCKELVRLTGKPIQLPSEAQWEYACRAGTRSDYYSGDGATALSRVGWYEGNSGKMSHPVGTLEANTWGLKDIHGNVWEWCQDNYDANFYAAGPGTDPVGITSPDSDRIIRGGSWFNPPERCTAGERRWIPPGLHDGSVGFRVCFRELDASEANAASEADRKGANYLLFIGAGATILRVNDPDRTPKGVTELPKDAFHLMGAACWGNRQVTDEGLANFKGVKHLTLLELGYAPVTDAALANFKECKNLTRLGLSSTKLTDTGLDHFKGCNGLTYLDLHNTQITDAGLVHFKDCKLLTHLNLGGTKVTDAGLAHFTDCRNLVQLCVNDSTVTDAGLRHFKASQNLVELVAFNTRLTDAGLDHLKEFKNLAFIAFGGTQVTDAGLARLKELKNLTQINLSNTQVTDVGFAHLKDCKNLVKLDLRTTKITAATVEELRKSLPLCQITWDGGTVDPRVTLAADRKAAEYVVSAGGTVRVNGTDNSIKAVAQLPAEGFLLTMVNLANNKQVTDAGFAVFKECKRLAYLELSNTPITDAGLANFKDCEHVTFLHLAGTQITDAGLANFKNCKNLLELNLWSTGVTDAGLLPFKDCKQLRGVILDGTKIGDAGLECFRGCKELTTLRLASTEITDAGLQHLKECESLVTLNLYGTRITDEGLRVLKECRKLASLKLIGTAIADPGVKHLADCKALTTLYLQKTKITAEGIEELKKALPKCRLEWDGGVVEPKAK